MSEKAQALRHLTESATHHVALAKAFKALDGHFSRMSECMKAEKSEMDGEQDPATFYSNLAGEFGKASAAHTSLAELHVEASKALKESHKVAGVDDDLSKAAPLPEGLSVTAPSVPLIRAVPRPGSAPLPVAAENPLFAKIYGTDEE